MVRIRPAVAFAGFVAANGAALQDRYVRLWQLQKG